MATERMATELYCDECKTLVMIVVEGTKRKKGSVCLCSDCIRALRYKAVSTANSAFNDIFGQGKFKF